MNIKITADSTCDLPQHLVEAYDIHLTPLYVVLGEQGYADRLEMTPAQMFEYMLDSKNTCYTSAVNVSEYQQAFSKYQHYEAIIHISLSGRISGSHGNALKAAEDFPNVYVVDSANVCGGSALMVERAVQMVAEGLGVQEIVDSLQKLAPKIEGGVILNTLEYLKRGGRCSSILEFGASLLQLKLVVEVKDGRIKPSKKYRGSFTNCAKKYMAERLCDLQNVVDKVVYVAATACPPELLAQARTLLEQTGYFKRIVEIEGGCVISCHSGPCAFGLFYELK
ncbi:MAG: DegV family protein [Clostridiales bacterium]|nr:DegV family protein [Clostridiales bacterium]